MKINAIFLLLFFFGTLEHSEQGTRGEEVERRGEDGGEAERHKKEEGGRGLNTQVSWQSSAHQNDTQLRGQSPGQGALKLLHHLVERRR